MKLLYTLLLQIIVVNALSQELKPIGSNVYHWNEFPVKKEAQRETRKILEGTTNEFSWFEIHATTQQKGAASRAPQAQDSAEELVIIKEGTLKCKVGKRTEELSAGSILLIPPHEMQTFENTGDAPVTYYVLMFRSKKPVDMARNDKAGGTLIIYADTLEQTVKDSKATIKYFDRPTAMCENYEMHITWLYKKGPSHAPHRHVDTEIILVTKGKVEMDIDGNVYYGYPGDLFIAESGSTHGVANASDLPCGYFAFKWR